MFAKKINFDTWKNFDKPLIAWNRFKWEMAAWIKWWLSKVRFFTYESTGSILSHIKILSDAYFRD